MKQTWPQAVFVWVPRTTVIEHGHRNSVADPDPSDPYVFGPPGSESGSISQRYGSDPAPDPDPSIAKQK
jgi:hypothetical protein